MPRNQKEGQEIVFKTGAPTDCPYGAHTINAAFSDVACLTPCPAYVTRMVGSLGCQGCEHYKGARNYGVSTGNESRFGFTTHHRDIYCSSLDTEGLATDL